MQFAYGAHQSDNGPRHIDYNMQLAVLNSAVYMLGGTRDSNMNEIVTAIRKWDLKTNVVSVIGTMPVAKVDFSTCTWRNRYILCIGGCTDFFNSKKRP